MLIDGVECSDRKKIAEKFNSYFVSVGKLEDKNTDQILINNFRDYMTDQNNTYFTFHPIDNIDMKQMIKNIRLSKSKGHDGISSEVLKLISNDISSSITLIINSDYWNFSNKLKIGKVVPIFKKDSKKEFQNYRPISVLPVISKIFELVIHCT